MDFYAGLAIGISSISAIGVYLAPLIQDKVKRSRDSREMHKQELTVHVLKPLIRQINYFLRQEIAIKQDQSFEKTTDDLVNKYANRKFDFVGIEPIYTSPKDLGKDNEWFDSDLFSDLENHFPDLSKEINEARDIITRSMPTYVRSRWELVGMLEDWLRPLLYDLADKFYENSNHKKSGITSADDMMRREKWKRVGILVALMKLFYYPNEQWPTLFETANSIDGLMKIVDTILEKDNIRKQADELIKIQNNITGPLDTLRNHLNEVATSGKILPGKCHYLGK